MVFGFGKKSGTTAGTDGNAASGAAAEGSGAAAGGGAPTTAAALWPPAIPGRIRDALRLGPSGGGSGGSATAAGDEYRSYSENPAEGLREGGAPVLSAPPRPVPGVYRPGRPYGGFSTSVCSMFQFTPEDGTADGTDPDRTDCCSMACCGILQADRTRYLLTGVSPPTLWKRMYLHVFVPLGIFLFAGFCAVTIPDQFVNSFLSTLLVLVLLLYVFKDCLRGTVKRRRVREEMLWRMREIDMAAEGRGDEAVETEVRAREEDGGGERRGGIIDLGQSKFAMTCVHRAFGCAARDLPTKDGEPVPRDFCGKLWKVFANACCGALCGCWFQFCGVCAMAQEAREIERLVPVGRRRIDYVTFEPYVTYYNPIKLLRATRNSNLMDHYRALSHLSLMMVKSLGVAVVSLLVLSLIKDSGFKWGDMLVFLATICQAFLILYFVHWKWNRFDISLDAVIKFFACGFVLTTGLAVFFELVETIFFQLVLLLFITIFGIQEVETQDFDATPAFGGGGGVTLRSSARGHGRFLQDQADDFAKTFALEYPVVVVIYLFLNAFLMAALVEELCKYFGYRMVEHPDFLTEEQMVEAAEAATAVAAAAAHHGAEDGADAASQASEGSGAYAPPQVGAEGAAAATATETAAATTTGGGGVNSSAASAQSTAGAAEALVVPEEGPRSLNSRGAAVTVAMVSVALGFACCENLIYIFVYNGSSLSREIAVLIARSLFPIHPLAAAIQSIGVCKRDLENDKTHRVGKTILPAVLLHGSFDFTLMMASFLVGLHDMKAVEDDSYAEKGELISFALSLCITFAGAAWYVKQSLAQKERLNNLDRSSGVGQQENTDEAAAGKGDFRELV